jgi:hypothetical protein
MRETVIWELGQVPRRMGGASGILIYAMALLALGVLMPWYLGFGFLDVTVMLAYAGLSVLLAGPVVAESVAGERERSTAPTNAGERRRLLHARVIAGALCGWSFSLLILLMGVTTVSLSAKHAVLPPALVSLDLAVISLTLSLATASTAAAISARASSAKHAKRSLRQGFLLLLVIAIYYSRFMPRVWKERATIPAAASGLTEFVVVVSVVLVGLSTALLKLAVSRLEDTEIRLNI